MTLPLLLTTTITTITASIAILPRCRPRILHAKYVKSSFHLPKSASKTHRVTPLHHHHHSTMASTAPPLKVLLLGVHMNPGEPLSEAQLLALITGDIARGASHNLQISHELTWSAEPEYARIAARLRSEPWDMVAVGAGVRLPRERSALLEWLVNAAVRLVRPGPPVLVFNETPDGVVGACLRVREALARIEHLEKEGE